MRAYGVWNGTPLRKLLKVGSKYFRKAHIELCYLLNLSMISFIHMSMEGLPKVSTHVESSKESDIELNNVIEKKYPFVDKAIFDLQLLYDYRKWNGKIHSDSKQNQQPFEELVYGEGAIDSELKKRFLFCVGVEFWENPEGFQKFQNDAAEALLSLRDEHSETWIEEVYSTLNEVTKSLEEIEVDEDDVASTSSRLDTVINPSNEVGLLAAKPREGTDTFAEIGLHKDDSYIELHIEALADLKNARANDIQNLFSKDSLHGLAVRINSAYRDSKMIIGESWLMDTPIAKRIGFTVLPKDLGIVYDQSFFGQFIDQDGNISKDRAREFLTTGEAPYKRKLGYIKTEDFLAKYL